MSGRVAGEVAIVTGSGSGRTGSTIARLLAAEGAQVVVTGRNAENGSAVAESITKAGGEACFVRADISNENECQALVEQAVSHFGSLTILVNNAVAPTLKGAPDKPVTELSTEAWEEKLRMNLTAPMWLCKYSIPHMVRAGHGSIVNVSSRGSLRATPGVASYVSSKGGLNSLTRSIAVDYGRRGIRCNAIIAGAILNEDGTPSTPGETDEDRAAMYLTRVPTVRDIAYAALWLASSETETITGTLIPVEGGSMAARVKAIDSLEWGLKARALEEREAKGNES